MFEFLTATIERTETRATLEDPNVPLTAEQGWDDMFGTTATASGVNVTSETVLGLPAVWRGCVLLGGGVADLPLSPYRKNADGTHVIAEDHPAYWVVHEQASRSVSAPDFWQTMVGRAVLGNAYAEIIRRNGGLDVSEMVLLDPLATWPVVENGVVAYRHRVEGGTGERTIAADNMFHLKGFGDGFEGFSVVKVLRDALGLPVAQQTHKSSFYKNNCGSNLVIEVPGKFKDKAAATEYRTRVNTMHAGAQKSFRPMILTDGAKANSMPLNHEDAQFLQSQEFRVRMVANILGLPPHLLADNSRAAYNSLEQENKSYLQHSLSPWLTKIKSEANTKLLRPSNYKTRRFFFGYSLDELTQADKKDEAEVDESKLRSGKRTINELRKKDNLPAFDMPEADLPMVPANLMFVGLPKPDPVEPEPPEPPVDEPAADEEDTQPDRQAAILAAHRRLVAHVTGQLAARIRKQAERKSKDAKSYMDWVDQIATEHGGVAKSLFLPVVEAVEAIRGGNGGPVCERICAAFFADVQAELLRAAECQPNELHQRVTEIMALHERHAPGVFADQLLGV